ncbi:hypothetical protein FRB99_004061 [Tulasnella sp. 403]|nr:hypothetical protein FRB99_004061 [Tulasnella sp. 403]
MVSIKLQTGQNSEARRPKFASPLQGLGPLSEEDPVCVYPLNMPSKKGGGTPLPLAAIIPSGEDTRFDSYINLMDKIGELYSNPGVVGGKKMAIIKRQLYTLDSFRKSMQSTTVRQCKTEVDRLRAAMKQRVLDYAAPPVYLYNPNAAEDSSNIIKWPADKVLKTYTFKDNSFPPPSDQDEINDDNNLWIDDYLLRYETICPGAWVTAKTPSDGSTDDESTDDDATDDNPTADDAPAGRFLGQSRLPN